jgi:hypothetical protein
MLITRGSVKPFAFRLYAAPIEIKDDSMLDSVLESKLKID